jgi:hypothetical protein
VKRDRDARAQSERFVPASAKQCAKANFNTSVLHSLYEQGGTFGGQGELIKVVFHSSITQPA